MKNTEMNKTSKTSEEWLKERDLIILDPGGWDRKNFQYSFYKELITEEEFKKRILYSTVMLRRNL